MNTKEAKTLINSKLKKYKLHKTKEYLALASSTTAFLACFSAPMAMMTMKSIESNVPIALPIFFDTMFVTHAALMGFCVYYCISDRSIKERIQLLKMIQKELKSGVNRFESVNEVNFDDELENQFKKRK